MEILETAEPVRVVVGSSNPVKINSSVCGISSALNCCLEGIVCDGIDVDSEVSNQPMGDEETKRGAICRAKNSFKEYQVRNFGNSPNFAVGLEGGVRIEGEGETAVMFCFAWAAVFNGTQIGVAKTAEFGLPRRIHDLVVQGMELGTADDTVFSSTLAKRKNGTVGHLTRDAIDRTLYYKMAVTLAMIPFLWPEMY